VWKFLEQLDEEIQGGVGLFLLLTPEEIKSSFANMEFEDPVTSEFYKPPSQVGFPMFPDIGIGNEAPQDKRAGRQLVRMVVRKRVAPGPYQGTPACTKSG
jgi:hypothetical protein